MPDLGLGDSDAMEKEAPAWDVSALADDTVLSLLDALTSGAD